MFLIVFFDQASKVMFSAIVIFSVKPVTHGSNPFGILDGSLISTNSIILSSGS
jgi:hypothetical protein